MFLMACIWSRQLSGAVSSVEAINSTVDMRVLTIRSSIDTRLIAGYVEGLQGLAGACRGLQNSYEVEDMDNNQIKGGLGVIADVADRCDGILYIYMYMRSTKAR
jgi:hypothetical protein